MMLSACETGNVNLSDFLNDAVVHLGQDDEGDPYPGVDTDTAWDGDCPYTCTSESICSYNGGWVASEYSCALAWQVCCVEEDVETDGYSPCPYACLSPTTCGGDIVGGFDCPSSWQVCCDEVYEYDAGIEDMDTAYDDFILIK